MPVWYWGVWERAHEKACCSSIPRRRATTSGFEVKSKAMGREQPVATGLDLYCRERRKRPLEVSALARPAWSCPVRRV
jgi:hypothetical protein